MFSTLNSSVRINELQRQIRGIWGSAGISKAQFRLQAALSSISTGAEVPQFVPFRNSIGGSALWVCTRGLPMPARFFRQLPGIDSMRLPKRAQ